MPAQTTDAAATVRTTVLESGAVEVVLSRKNIESLLAKLDGNPPSSACTILGPTLYPATILRAEEDDVHYAHLSRKGEEAGTMHSATESAIAGYRLVGRDAGASHYEKERS